MEEIAQSELSKPIRPPSPPDPFDPWSKFEQILKSFYRLKESRWYVPLLAVLAFIAGYFLFPIGDTLLSKTQKSQIPIPKETTGSIAWKWVGTYYGEDTDRPKIIDDIWLKISNIFPNDPYQNARIIILPVGKFFDGQYKGNVLSLALFQFADIEIKNGDSATYLYYISDSNGNPIAWDKKLYHNFNAGCPPVDCPWLPAIYKTFTESLGLTESLQTFLEPSVPHELLSKVIITDTNIAFTIREDRLQVPDYPITMIREIGKTKSGWSVIETGVSPGNSLVDRSLDHYLILPFGRAIKLE